MDVDDLLKVEPEALIPQLDRIQPDWWIKYADSDQIGQAMYNMGRKNSVTGQYPSPGEMDRHAMVLKRRVLRDLLNVVWLCGHAALHIGKETSE